MTITIIGDYDENKPSHFATNEALKHAAYRQGIEVKSKWLNTDGIGQNFDSVVLKSDSFLIAPGGPYKDRDAVLKVIRYARVHNKPTLGTCGGFQHIVLEYARNVLAIKSSHPEYEAAGADNIITPLTCNLHDHPLEITIDKQSKVYRVYRTDTIGEQYFCNYGLNRRFQQSLDKTGLKTVGKDETGESRILELEDHMFFIATLFVPQVNSSMSRPNPLISALLRAGQK